MGCTSAKQVSAVPSSEEGGPNKSHSNGDLLSDEYRMKGVEKVKYLSADEGGADGSDSTVRLPVPCVFPWLFCNGEVEF
ncbi:unnamed protein product [Tetraodon nigroviridis]|uniref:(spotted green pufferfish) hypothetical protein n=1 Tax=Tetraodon nigroviridis TaxID=99883 RepID=Q4SP67_TETNG|nr:unnamed protein product [Tetraodon nigroviridis]